MFKNTLSYFSRRIIGLILSVSLAFSPAIGYAQSVFVSTLPEPGKMVGLSEAFTPVLVKGIVVHPEKPFNFDFIVDSGNDSADQAVVKEQSQRIAQYFLAAITVPEDQLWVNLSPYEKDRVIENELGQTVLGRDMLAQDYILKQLTSSLIYPEKGLGKEFWARVYAEAQAKFGTTDIPIDTFNKVWIMPEKAEVFEKGNAVYVTGAKLKVMLDSDRTAMMQNASDAVTNEKAAVAKTVMHEIVLPAIEKEVNEGRNFAPLRQVYHAAILAKWYRELVQDTLMSKAYVGKNKVVGVDSDDKTLKEQIYQRYISAYKKGVFNYIKEENDVVSGTVVPRKYFSGGLADFAMKDIPLVRAPRFVDKTVGEVFEVDFAMTPGVDRTYRYPAGQVDVTLTNSNKNYVKTSLGGISLGLSMLHRALVPDKEDFPSVIIAPPSGEWFGKDGSNVMQIYFPIAANFAFHGRKTTIVVRDEQEKQRVIKYLDLGNPYFLPNEAGYPQEFINQLRREAIALADRMNVAGHLRIVSPTAILENDSNETTMVDFKVLSNGETQIGDVKIVDKKDGTVKVIDGQNESVLDGNNMQEIQVAVEGVEPLTTPPEFGVTFLGTSSGMDANGLASNQVVWVGHKGVLIDAGPAAVGSLEALNVAPSSMEYVVLTHMHEDHVAGMLAYFSWLKRNGRPIKMLVEPGIFKLFKEQAEVILNTPLESAFDVQVIPLKFNETLTLGSGEDAVRIKTIPAFHGTPTTQLRISYRGHSISHSSDTTMAPLRVDAFAEPGLPGISDDIKADLERFTDYKQGQPVFDRNRAGQIKEGLFSPDEDGLKPNLVIYEAGYGKPTVLSDTNNHTSAFDLGNLPEDDQRKIVINHTAQLPAEASPLLKHAKALTTIDLSKDFAESAGIDNAAKVSDVGGIDIQNIIVDKNGVRRIRFNDAAMNQVFNADFEGFRPVFIRMSSVDSLRMIFSVN